MLRFHVILDRTAVKADSSLQKVWVAKVRDRKDIAYVVKTLSTILPIPQLQHLKRVKTNESNEVWVILKCVEDEEEYGQSCKKIKLDFKSNLNFTRESSDLFPQLIQKGFNSNCLEEISQVNVPLEPSKTRQQFEADTQIWPVKFHPDKQLETLLSHQIFSDDEERWHEKCLNSVIKTFRETKTNSVLIACPIKKEVIAEGFDRRKEHPLDHAVMVAVENVAKINHLDQYLCTNLDAYLALEPCPMCAMALVHSRVKRVFFHENCPKMGAFVSRCQVHILKDLNHHYTVFQGVFIGN